MRLECNGRALAGLAIIGAGAIAYLGVARAGDLNPPAGLVSPTMTTLGEVGDGVAELAALRVPMPSNTIAVVIEHIQGDAQGPFPQDAMFGGQPIVGLAFDARARIDSAYDAGSGLPTGKRQHKPFRVTKPVDKATPLLMHALANNENLGEVRLAAWGPDEIGVSVRYLTVELTNARVVQVDQALEQGGGSGFAYREHVSFTYQKITWTWNDGGIVAEDDWRTPGH